MELTHIALFAGIGGDTLAAQWAGFRTVLFVENDDFCQRVLRKHWPDVPIIGDIKDVTEETIANARQFFSIRESTDGKRGNRLESPCSKASQGYSHGRRRINQDTPITLITGGFPCQPVSVAGKRRGKEDDRWLWPDMLRVISIVRPTWVVAENVTGLLHMGFYDCLSDLEGQGYETASFVIPACGVNAPHRRDRIFIVANSQGNRTTEGGCQPNKTNRRQDVGHASREGLQNRGRSQVGKSRGTKSESKRPSSQSGRLQDVPDTEGEGLEGSEPEGTSFADGCAPERSEDVANAKKQYGNVSDNHRRCRPGPIPKSGNGLEEATTGSSWWAVEPDVGRVAYGIPDRVDRLKGLGNAIVPQQIYPILKGIAEIEKSMLLE